MAENVKIEETDWVGKQVYFYIAPFWILCHVIQTRAIFGRLDLQVSPVNGSGQKWVRAESIEIPEKESEAT